MNCPTETIFGQIKKRFSSERAFRRRVNDKKRSIPEKKTTNGQKSAINYQILVGKRVSPSHNEFTRQKRTIKQEKWAAWISKRPMVFVFFHRFREKETATGGQAVSSWNPSVLTPKKDVNDRPMAQGGESAVDPSARVSTGGKWRTEYANGVPDSALSGADAKKRLGELLGVKRASKNKKTAKPVKKAETGLSGVGSALGPVADGAYALACMSGTAAQAIKALDEGAQSWQPLSPQNRSAELFAMSRGESMAPVLQAAGPAPAEWLQKNSGLALELACASKSLTILKMLVASGARLDAPNAQGKTALETALAKRWDNGALALLAAGARMEPANQPPALSAAELLAKWKDALGRPIGAETPFLTAEFERRALMGIVDGVDAFVLARKGLWDYSEPEFQAARETALGDGTDSLLPGIDWANQPEPGEMARRLRYARDREKEAAKPKRVAKRM